MALKITRFLLHLTDRDPVDVTVMPADRMRAERLSGTELPPSQRGAGAESHPETWVLLWLWCAATRLQVTAARFDAFADTVAGYERLDATGRTLDDTEEDDDAAVDPTPEEASTTAPSSSPPTSETSPVGSTPTVTPA